jgi:hypothetical protein
MSKIRTELAALRAVDFVSEIAKSSVGPAFAGDVDAAHTLWLRLPHNERGVIARAMWAAKVSKPAFTKYLENAWLQDHQHVIGAAGSRRALWHMFKYANLDRPDALESIPVWRGTIGLGLSSARLGCSWTTDRDIACWFAMNFAPRRFADASALPPLVISATVRGKEVSWTTDCGNEKEIVLAYGAKNARICGNRDEWTVAASRHQIAMT